MSKSVIIGEQMGMGLEPHHDQIKEWLQNEQKNGKPCWFDGSYLYTTHGKYAVLLGAGSGSLFIGNRIHNLTLAGVLRSFEPYERYAWNKACQQAWERQQHAIDQKAQKLREDYEQKRMSDIERRRLREEQLEWIRAWAAHRPRVRGRRTMMVAWETDRIVTAYGGLCVWNPSSAPGKWVISHLASGRDLVRDVESHEWARLAVALIEPQHDWSQEKLSPTPELLEFGHAWSRYVKHEATFDDLEFLKNNLRKISD